MCIAQHAVVVAAVLLLLLTTHVSVVAVVGVRISNKHKRTHSYDCAYPTYINIYIYI